MKLPFNIKLDSPEDIGGAIKTLLPIAVEGSKTAIGLIRDLASIWHKDELSLEDRMKLINDRKSTLLTLQDHEFGPGGRPPQPTD